VYMEIDMKSITCLCLCLCVVSLNAGQWIWGKSIGGEGMERLWEIAGDASGNVLMTGEFEGTLMIGEQAFPGMGLTDTFLIKYDSQGSLIWCVTLVGESENAGLGLGTDSLGNAYLGGYFTGTMYCQQDSVVSNGMWDTYIAKFDPLGELIWLRSFGGQFNDIIHGLAVSPEGQVFAAGWFADAIDFGDGLVLQSFGGSDVLLISLSAEGNVSWVKQAGTIGVEYGYKVSCDDAGNSFVTGSASFASDFDGLSLMGDGMFVASYDSAGNIRWISPSQNALVISISNQRQSGEDQRGAVAGRLLGSGNIGDFTFDATGLDNQFYWAEFDAQTGAWVDLQVHGGEGDDRGRDCDYSEDLFVLGTFSDSSNFLDMELLSAGAEDIVFYGATTGVVTAGGPNAEVPFAICRLENGNIAIGGWHFGAFDLDSIVIDSGNDYNQNAFIALYSPYTSNQDYILSPASFTCYPNPFKASIQIKTSKPHASLNVYNVKGQKLQSLAVSSKGEAFWDGRLPSGKEANPGLYILEVDGECQKVLKIH